MGWILFLYGFLNTYDSLAEIAEGHLGVAAIPGVPAAGFADAKTAHGGIKPVGGSCKVRRGSEQGVEAAVEAEQDAGLGAKIGFKE